MRSAQLALGFAATRVVWPLSCYRCSLFCMEAASMFSLHNIRFPSKIFCSPEIKFAWPNQRARTRPILLRMHVHHTSTHR